MAIEHRQHGLGMVGEPFVVGVEKGDDRGPWPGRAPHSGGRDTRVGPADQGQPGIQPVERIRGPVAGLAVDDEQLEVRPRLAQHAADRPQGHSRRS